MKVSGETEAEAHLIEAQAALMRAQQLLEAAEKRDAVRELIVRIEFLKAGGSRP